MTGSDDRFMKLWRLETWEEDARQTEVTEIDTIREHCDYINAAVIRDNYLISSSGDINVIVQEFPNPNPVPIDIEPYAPAPTQVPIFRPSPPPSPKYIKTEKFPVAQIEIVPAIETEGSPDEGKTDECVPEPEEAEMLDEEIGYCQEVSVNSSDSSSDTSNSKARRRRWIIYKDEVELKEEIGKGRYGVVYRGIYKKKVVAVKVSNKISEEEYTNTEEGIVK